MEPVVEVAFSVQAAWLGRRAENAASMDSIDPSDDKASMDRSLPSGREGTTFPTPAFGYEVAGQITDIGFLSDDVLTN